MSEGRTRASGSRAQACAVARCIGAPWRMKIFASAFTASTMLVLCGCAAERLAAVPEQSTNQARVVGVSNARFYVDREGLVPLAREAIAANERERAALGLAANAPLPPANFLALSGGGDNGAFGAGLLTGWSAKGSRPTFKIVTGISTGALSAPFAFLGPAYDPMLRDMYTQISAADVMSRPSALSAITGESAADSSPLMHMITRYLTDDVIAGIAEQYRKGRLLLVASTNLDAGRAVIWNIGAIAASGDPNARTMIARILLASASIPAAFPPVLFNVEVGGKTYQEMHVDGGAITQAFLYPPGLTAGTRLKRRYTAYIVRNGRLTVPWEQVHRETLAIAGRAVSTLIAANGFDDLYRMYATTRRDGVGFNLAYIRDDFTVPYKGPFDPGYMNALFDYGYAQGRAGYRWDKVPPGFDDRAVVAAVTGRPR